MASRETYDRLLPIFRDVFDNDDIALSPELTAADVSEWDSLSNIRLFVAIEMAFDVKFGTTELMSLENVGQLADLVELKAAEREASQA